MKDERGISIVFASLAMAILLVLGGIIVAYGYSNYNRALSSKQAKDNYEYVMQATRTLYGHIETNYTSDADSNRWSQALLTNQGAATIDFVAGNGATGAQSGWDYSTRSNFGHIKAVSYEKESGTSGERKFTIICFECDESGEAKPDGVTLCFDVELIGQQLTKNTLMGIYKAGQ